MEKDYFVPFADYGEDKFEEKRSKFTGRLWHVETAEEAVAKMTENRRARQACRSSRFCVTRT